MTPSAPPPSAGSPAPRSGQGPHVELRGVRVRFGRRPVFDELDCAFPRGRITIVMGGSGTGKSTILKLIGGLIRPDAGQVFVAGEETTRLRDVELNRVRRRLGMLFQDGALLDSMTVFDNVALPLREHTDLSAAEIAEEVERRLSAVGLEDVSDLLPGQLSGGMLRRVGLARAIVMDPEILLCDEPLSGLDPPNVHRIQHLMTDLNRKLGLTLIVCSHHLVSVHMADQLVLLMGRRAVCGTPDELASSPDPEVSGFLRFEEGELVPRRRESGPS